MPKDDSDNASSRPGRKPTFKQELFAAEYVKSNGNGVAAARAAGYKGDGRQLATQASVNLKNPGVRESIAAKLEALQEPALERLADALDATKTRCFLTRDGDIVYSEPEADHKTRLHAVKLILDHRPIAINSQSCAGDPQGCGQLCASEAPVGAQTLDVVSDMDPADRAAFRQASEIEKQLAELDCAEVGEGKDESAE